jgi:hypothetical protein
LFSGYFPGVWVDAGEIPRRQSFITTTRRKLENWAVFVKWGDERKGVLGSFVFGVIYAHYLIPVRLSLDEDIWLLAVRHYPLWSDQRLKLFQTAGQEHCATGDRWQVKQCNSVLQNISSPGCFCSLSEFEPNNLSVKGRLYTYSGCTLTNKHDL